MKQQHPAKCGATGPTGHMRASPAGGQMQYPACETAGEPWRDRPKGGQDGEIARTPLLSGATSRSCREQRGVIRDSLYSKGCA